MEIVRVEKLSKTYGKGEAQVAALKNVSFSMERGQFGAVVGESGSGKSTLLNCVGGLDRADAGTIPIIAMTANAFAEDEKAALDAGMDAHVAKPLDVELLKRVIRQYTEKERTD